MATSGSYDFTATRDQIINRALRLLGVVSQGDVASAEQIKEGSEALNAMVKFWQTEKIYLWSTEWKTKTFSASDEATGTDGKVYTCILSHTSADANKPVTGANYSTYWVQRGSTGGVWVSATSYSAIGDFELDNDTIDVVQAFLRNGDSDTPVELRTIAEYFALASKGAEGKPSAMSLHKTLPPMKAYLHYQPDSTDYVLHYLQVRALEDFDQGANTPDFPARWIDPLVFGLAAELGPEYGAPADRQKYLDSKAEELRRRARTGDEETFSGLFARPSWGR